MGNTVEKEEIIIRCSAQEMVKNFVKDYEIIWHDPNINTPENLQYISQFNSFCQVRTFTDWKEASTYTTQANTACHLITSGTNGELLVKETHQIPNVSKIYVFCGNKAFHQTWAKNYPKIICVENNIKILVIQIEQNMLQWQRQTSSLRVGLPAFAPIFDDMDKSEMNYLHLNLKGLANFKNRQQAKEDFLALSRVIFPDKTNISKFESSYKKYDMKQILRWYTKESFLYKVANNCLRIASSDAIQYCRLILKDLEKAVREQYQLKSKLFSGLLYRGAYISEKEWANLLSNMGKDIEMYGFLSTSKSKEKAEEFVLSDHERKVLITIIVPQGPDKGEQGFAEVREFSYFPAEEEILFNVRSRFTILEAAEEESSGKKFRHLVLLYGAQEWRLLNMLRTKQQSVKGLTKPVHRILMERKVICIGCKNEISGTVGGGSYFISLLETKRESICEQCLEGYLTINKGPLLYVQQGKGGIITENKQRIYEIKGIMMRYPIQLNIPLYGYSCSRCETGRSKCYYKCVECPKNENLWCKECFKGGEECSEKGHNIILEARPFSFWTEEMTEQEFKHLNFQEDMIKKDNVFEQADIFFKSNQYEKAIQYYNKFIESVKPETSQEDLAVSYHNLGLVFTNLGKYEESLENLFKSLDIARTLYGFKHPDIAMLYNNIGLAYDSMDNHEEALKFYFMSLELYKALYGDNHQDVAMLLNNIGLVFDSLGKSEEALEYHFKAIEIKKTVYGENHPTVGTSYNNIGLTYDNLGKNKEALDSYFKALEIKKAVYGEKHADIAMLYNNIGLVYGSLKKYPKALKHHLKSLEIKRLVYGENHPDIALAYNNIGLVYESQGKNEEALKNFGKSLEISKGYYGENHQDVAMSYQNIGRILKEMGQFEESLGNLEKSCEIKKSMLGEKHTSVVQINRIIEQVIARINKKNKKKKGTKMTESNQKNDSSP